MPKAVVFQLIAALLQVGLAFLIAAAVWLIAARKKCGFRDYFGLAGAPSRTVVLAFSFGVALGSIVLLLPSLREMAAGPNTVAGSAVRETPHAWIIPVLLVLAIFKTALSEELLFRGLIGKRLIAHLGFVRGNGLQALIFAAVHLFIFWLAKPSDMVAAALFILLIGGMGWVNGWLNEIRAGGSILPGWVAHAATNVAAYFLAAGLPFYPS